MLERFGLKLYIVKYLIEKMGGCILMHNHTICLEAVIFLPIKKIIWTNFTEAKLICPVNPHLHLSFVYHIIYHKHHRSKV